MDFWCAEQIVVTVEGPTGRSEVSIAQPFARIGSHPESEVVIADPAIARRCLYLHATPSGLYCLFLDIAPSDVARMDSQSNGMWLHPEQDVVVGDYRIRARRLAAEEGADLPVENLATWGSASPPLPVLMVHCGGLLKDKRRFRARLSPLGRRPQCGLQLKGKKVSSFHCVLYWDQEQLWCIDLHSSNGTTLNGESISVAQVAIGDRLDVGEFGLVFQRLSGGGRPRRSDELRELDSRAATDQRSENAPVVLAATAAVAGPVPELLAQLEEGRQLQEQLTAEVARLENERQETQSRWEQESQALRARIGRLQEEASRQADERQALEASCGQLSDQQTALTSQLEERSGDAARLLSELTVATATLADRSAELAAQRQAIEKLQQDWQVERQSLTEQLTARAEQFARLEADLAAATTELTRRQAEEDEQAQVAATAPIAEFLQAQLAPATVVAGLEPDADVRLSAVPEVSWSYTPVDPAADAPPAPDPQLEMWDPLESTCRHASLSIL